MVAAVVVVMEEQYISICNFCELLVVETETFSVPTVNPKK